MNIPVLYTEKKDCCGCTACAAVCPQEAIVMQADEEGFAYPHINADKCIGCCRCTAVCPIRHKEKNRR